MNMTSWQLNGKHVLLRIDGNVPLSSQGGVQNDFRLKAVIPTIEYLLSRGALVTIITHLGRPQGYDPRFSTRSLQEWFLSHGFSSLVVRENLRFSPGEKNHDLAFAQELARGMDYYVNDAWGVMHREDTSVTLLPQLFPQDCRSYGFLVAEELSSLQMLREKPEAPYVIILGGGKIETKLAYLSRLITTHPVQAVLFLPGASNIFSVLNNMSIGCSVYEEKQRELAAHFIKKAQENNTQLILPTDYVYIKDDLCGALGQSKASEVPKNALLMSPGPESLQRYATLIQNTRTIFINGVSGFSIRPETMASYHQILCMIADSQAYTVAGGGDTVAEIQRAGLTQAFDFCSTGGGATLAYISGEQLPGLDALKE